MEWDNISKLQEENLLSFRKVITRTIVPDKLKCIVMLHFPIEQLSSIIEKRADTKLYDIIHVPI